MTNALFMHNRAPCYEWHWEHFIVEYQVFDALFRVASRSDAIRDRGHSRRFESVATRYNLHFDEARIARIVNLRNDLLHEVLWSGEMPMTGGGGDAYYALQWLRGINHRLIFAVLGFTGAYIQSSWVSQLTFELDLDQLAFPRSAQLGAHPPSGT